MADHGDITIRGGALPPGRTRRTFEVELHNSEPSAVEAVRATVTQPPINAELLEHDGKFYLRGPEFAFFAAERQGYVKRILGEVSGDGLPAPIPMDLPNLPTRNWLPFAGATTEQDERFTRRLLNGNWNREFLGTPRAPEPSPGPWTVKPYESQLRYPGARTYRVFVVLDANGKCVAECDSQVDAIFIAAARERGPT